MGKLDKLMLTLYGTILLACGVLTGLTQFNVISFQQIQDYLNSVGLNRSYDLAILGFVVSLIGLSLLNIAFYRSDKKKVLSYRTKKGDVKIVLSAIEEFVRKTALKRKEVKDAKVKVTVRGRKLRIHSRIALSSDVNITNVADAIQGDIEEKIVNMVGFKLPVEVNVSVVKMSIAQSSFKDTEEALETQEEEMNLEEAFEGIKY